MIMNASTHIRAYILIIEDELLVAETFRELLETCGYEAEVTLTGAAGLRSVRERRPDAVLLDVHIPGANGLDVLQEIQRLDATIPVIIVTGVSDDYICREAMVRGAYGWLAKPVGRGVLKKHLSLALTRRRLVAG